MILYHSVEFMPPKKKAVNGNSTRDFPKVIKVSDSEYQLPCVVCGAIAVTFAIGIPQFSEEKAICYTGIVHGAGINLKAADRIFTWLEQEQIGLVHAFLEKHIVIFEEGIDAYCPECDKIYCSLHYATREEWDDGFYDCTYGTCPENHTRIIHD